jgi:hypothetical protein
VPTLEKVQEVRGIRFIAGLLETLDIVEIEIAVLDEDRMAGVLELKCSSRIASIVGGALGGVFVVLSPKSSASLPTRLKRRFVGARLMVGMARHLRHLASALVISHNRY